MTSSTNPTTKLLLRLSLGVVTLVLVLFIGFQTSDDATAGPQAKQEIQVANGLTLAAVFSPDVLPTGGISTLTFTITNVDSAPHSGVMFTNVLPAGVVLATPAMPTDNCRGSLTAPDGGDTITFVNGRMGIGVDCTVSVQVTSSTVGTHPNTSGALSSNGGTHNTASDSLSVAADRPTFTLSASPSSISINTISRLTFTIDNSLNPGFASSIYFTHNLPNGITVATPPNITTDCNQLPTATSGTGQISFGPSAFLLANTSCTIEVDIIGIQAGNYDLVTGELTSSNVSSGVANTPLTVIQETLNKSFINDPASPGDQVIVQYLITNRSREGELNSLTFSDNFDSALSGLTAVGLPLNDVCGAGSTLSGTSTLVLSDGTLGAQEECQFEVTLVVPPSASVGSYTSTSGTLSGQYADTTPFTGSSSNDTLVISAASLLSMSFSPSSIEAGENITATFSLTNTSQTDSATAIAFNNILTDYLPGVSVNTLPPANFCGTGSSMTQVLDSTEGLTLFMTSGSLNAAASCTFDVVLTTISSMPQGVYTNTTESLVATINSETYYGKPADGSLNIIEPPRFSAAFSDDTVVPGSTTELVYTIDHSGTDDALPPSPVTGLSFTHNLDTMLSGLTAVGLPTADNCGIGSTLSGTSIITFTGGTLASGDTCQITATVQIPADAPVGTITGPTSELSATIDTLSITAPTVSPELNITTVAFSHRFLTNPVLPGEATEIEYTITNTGSTHAATNLAFSHNLNAIISGLAYSNGNLTDICGIGLSLSGATFLTISGGTLNPSESCVFTIEVTVPGGSSTGNFNSVTSNMTADVNSDATILDPSATTLIVDTDRLILEKAFTGVSTLPGITQTLVYTLTNLDTVNPISDIAFTDNLTDTLSGLSAIGLPLNDSCGTGSTLSGTDTVSLSGGNLPAGGSCTFTFSLSVPSSADSGTYQSTSSSVLGQINSLSVDGAAASSSFNITQMQAASMFTAPAAPNTLANLAFSLSSPDIGIELADLNFTSDLNELIPGMQRHGPELTDICGLGSALSGTSILSFTNGSIREFGSCTFTTTVRLPAVVPQDSYTYTLDAIYETDASVISLPITATLSIIRPEVELATTVSDQSGTPGQPITYTLTISNSGPGTATDISVLHPVPAEVDVSAIITSSLPVTLTNSSGDKTLAVANLASGMAETITLTGIISPNLNSDSSLIYTAIVTATSDVLTTNNSVSNTLSITVPKVSIDVGSTAITVAEESGSAVITLTLDNPNPHAPVTVLYSTNDGTATGSSDFTSITDGAVSIPAGSTQTTITIPILDDTDV